MSDKGKTTNCFSNNLHEKNCICSEIMFSSDVGIVIFKNDKKEPIFWNEEAIRLLSNCTNNEYLNDLWNFFEKYRSEKRTNFIRIKDKIIEFNLYKTENFKWALLKDITEQKRLENIVEEMNYMENITNIFSSIRHEITNPLITAKITLSVLKKKLNSSSEEEKNRYIERMEESLKRMEKTIASLKSFSMYNETEIENIEINQFIETEISHLTPYLEENNTDLILNLTSTPLIIKGTVSALRQILLNIIFNAVDALIEQEQPQIEIKTFRKNNKGIIQISNNGEQIPKENLPRIFEPFYTTKSKGTGLGMAIVKKFILKMNGRIDVKSNPDKTTFTIEFNLIKQSEDN